MTPNALHTKRLVLRPCGPADRADMVAGLNNLAVSQWLARVPFPFTDADVQLDTERGDSRWPQLMGIERDGRIIGGLSVGAHFGFWIAQDHWGQGYGREAATAAVPVALQLSDIIESGYFVGNTASARILHGLGFKIVGRGSTHCRALNRDLPDVTLQLRAQDAVAA